MKLYKQGNVVVLERKSGLLSWCGLEDININEGSGGEVVITSHQGSKTEETRVVKPEDIQIADGSTPFTTLGEVVESLITGVDVNISDQTTPAILAPFNNIRTNTQLTNAVAVNDYQITVDNIGVADLVINNYCVLFDPVSTRFSQFYITGIAGNVIALDRLIDFDYPAGTFVDIGTTNMANAGIGASLANPVIFGLRGPGSPLPGVDITFDVTRLMFGSTTDLAVDLSTFCDIPALTNGLTFRRRDGLVRNIFNIKSNGALKLLAYDWTPYSSTNPNQGQDGMGARLTFAGQNKIGVAIRLPLGDDLEVVITDDLSDIASLYVIAEGHITNPY
jgi:hypothetical protein